MDITAIFDHYRVSATALWNTAFWPDPEFRNWDSFDQFKEISRMLFRELVLAKIDKEWPPNQIFVDPIPFIRIVPNTHVPILIQRSVTERGYWDNPVKNVKQDDAEMLFLEYFDWNCMDYLDFRYYRVKIAKFDTHREVENLEALIERGHATVHLVD
jgi:hypothetical protein